MRWMKRAVSQELDRQETSSSLESWCRYALSPVNQKPAAHHMLLIAWLEAVSRGECDRLMILMPPGAGKSIYTSMLFPAWFLCQHPRASVIAASHTAELAHRFGRRVRNLSLEHAETLGYALRADSAAAGRWETDKGGEYYAIGVGGSVTGRRADIAVLDDLVGSRADAESEVERNNVWEWYRADLYTRLKPGGRIVLIMTRWHMDDIGGRLLAEMEVGGDQWKVLKLPALAVEDDPLGRAVGEALWPEWEDAQKLDRKRMALGERDWSALFQQEPTLAEGAIFKVNQITTVDSVPDGEAVRAWDLAATRDTGTNNPDWTVGIKLVRARHSDRFIVADVFRDRLPPEGVEAAILRCAEVDGTHVRVGIPKDPGQAGVHQIDYLTKRLIGYYLEAMPVSGDKATRAMPAASQMNNGNFSILRAEWNRRFVDEIGAFPNGSKDDQVDALSYGFSLLNPNSLNIWARLAG